MTRSQTLFFLCVADPCAPGDVEVSEPSEGNCSVTWTSVPWANYYNVYVKRDDGTDLLCNTTNTFCYYPCHCSYTYLTTIFAFNNAGPSPPGLILNHTTSVYTLQLHTNTYYIAHIVNTNTIVLLSLRVMLPKR